jgi:hypothetical protein
MIDKPLITLIESKMKKIQINQIYAENRVLVEITMKLRALLGNIFKNYILIHCKSYKNA